MTWKHKTRKRVVIPKAWFGWFSGTMALRVKVAMECKRMGVRKADRTKVLEVVKQTQNESK